MRHPNIERYFASEVTQEEKDQIMDHVIDCPRCSILLRHLIRKKDIEKRVGPCPSDEELRQAIVDPKLIERIRPHLQECGRCNITFSLMFLEEHGKAPNLKSRQ